MQRIKDCMNKVQTFIIEKRNYWYFVVIVIALMMFANIELLSMIIPTWATYLINAVLIIVTTVYARLLIVNLKEKIKEKKAEDEAKLYAFLEKSFKEVKISVRSVDENVTNSTEFIKNEICSSKEMILTDIKAKAKDISEEFASIQKHEDEAHELLKNRIEQFEAANNVQLENNTSKILNSVKITENSLKENLSEQTDLINRNAESNKTNIDESREALFRKIKANGNKTEENTTNINKNIEEVRNMLTESVTKLLETTDASLQAAQKENIDIIANQTKELIVKLDNILSENKHLFDGNLEELEKSRDFIVKKLSTIDEANQLKIKEYHEIVEGKLASTDERLIKEFSNIKELAIKLNLVSEALEGLEQRTVSAITESSTRVSQEVKDGVIQSTSHMNDVSERVIEIIQNNDNDTVEKLDYQSQEILSAISGSGTKVQENFDSLVGVLSEVRLLLNEVETEISNAEKGNAELTEDLKKSIAFELQNVGDELSKIEGTQKDSVVQIIELVDSKLLELNQELVKQANSILDKSEENTDYVSEKYNRVFDQIQSVAKESRILINQVDDAIEENKNTIIRSRNSVIDSIGNHFQDVKNKEKELESFKTFVERNFLNISYELEITRGQLSSLNLLSVLIKNLSEKKEDKSEKKQNRIETIEDPESGLIVKNEYKQDKLVTSQMYRGSKKVYDVFYGNKGEIVSTKNYGESGKVSLEMTYHTNGQVKERIEYISGKTERSEFDANGNKIR